MLKGRRQHVGNFVQAAQQLAIRRLDIERTGELLPLDVEAAHITHAHAIMALGKTGCGRGHMETIMQEASRRAEANAARYITLDSVRVV